VTQRVMAAAWAEQIYGVGREAGVLVYARFGSGVASGIILNNQIYDGSSFTAGDVSGLTVSTDNPDRRQGTLQALVTRGALVDRAGQLLGCGEYAGSAVLKTAGGTPDQITLEMICAAALAGDALAHRVIVEAGRYIGVAITNLIGILDPAIVVLGGPLAQAGHVLLAAVREEVQRRSDPYAYTAVQILLSELGELGPAMGAASLALKQFLSPTQLPDIRTPVQLA
jgi:predicted NBD/HSP70 family sugar kinase